jgi:hypothetical protein
MQEAASSSVTYTLTMEDLVTFNLFNFRHSPTIRKIQRRALISWPLTTFLCVLGVLLLTRLLPFWPALCTAFACTVWTAGCMVYYQKHGYIKRVRKLAQQIYSENKHPGLIGEHTLEVDSEGITHVNAYSRTRYAWGALERIETEPGYTYLYLGSQTFILRHQAIISGDFKAFLEQISRHHQPDRAIAR